MNHFALPVFLTVVLLFFSACSGGGGTDGTSSISYGPCNLSGTWKRCSQESATSIQMELVPTLTHMTINIRNYGNANCAGDPLNATTPIRANWIGGALSPIVLGAYTMQITPEAGSDLGCGVNRTVYTNIRLDLSCNSFYMAEISAPMGCSSTNQGTNFSLYQFYKQ